MRQRNELRKSVVEGRKQWSSYIIVPSMFLVSLASGCKTLTFKGDSKDIASKYIVYVEGGKTKRMSEAEFSALVKAGAGSMAVAASLASASLVGSNAAFINELEDINRQDAELHEAIAENPNIPDSILSVIFRIDYYTKRLQRLLHEKLKAGVHTNETPRYSFTDEEIEELKRKLARLKKRLAEIEEQESKKHVGKNQKSQTSATIQSLKN